jgi:hypothetical protein
MKKALVFIGSLVFTVALLATVTFDPNTGTGFVGKGDVQSAFGWNNAQAQLHGTEITFTFNSTDTYSATCEFFTGPDQHRVQHDVTIPRHVSVNGTITYDARTHKQIDGYILTGFGEGSTSGGTVPVVGEICVAGPGIAQDGTWVEVTLVSSGGDGGLFVNWNGSSVQIWP